MANALLIVPQWLSWPGRPRPAWPTAPRGPAARWNLKRSESGNTETELAFMAFIDREFAKADRNLDARLDFDEFCTLFATVAASMKT